MSATTLRQTFTLIAAILACGATGCVHASRGAAGRPLRVTSYNIGAGTHSDLHHIASELRAENADVVALQEVDVHWHARSEFADQAAALAQALHMDFRFAHIYDLQGATPGAPRREFGVALLSRFPIVEFRNHRITRLSTQEQGAAPSPMPGFLDVVLNVSGVQVRAFNTHLDYRTDPAVRVRQVADMLAIIRDVHEPTLLFGDLNAPPTAAELRPLLDRLTDSWGSANGDGFTYPADAPAKRIDYVLASPQFRVESAHVPITEASDHRPLVANLWLYP